MITSDLLALLYTAEGGAQVDLEIITNAGVIRAQLASVQTVLVRSSPSVGAHVRTVLRLVGARDDIIAV